MAKISTLVGNAFEDGIKNKLTVLQQLRVISWWEKQKPDLFSMGVVRRGPRMVPVWGLGAASGADFHGTIAEGLSFAVEAKSTGPDEDGAGSLIREVRISPKQVDHLDAIAASSGLAFLAAQFRRDAAPWLTAVIPWALVPWERAKTRHYLRPEAAEPWRLPQGAHLFEHLVDGARRLKLTPAAQ